MLEHVTCSTLNVPKMNLAFNFTSVVPHHVRVSPSSEPPKYETPPLHQIMLFTEPPTTSESPLLLGALLPAAWWRAGGIAGLQGGALLNTGGGHRQPLCVVTVQRM